jgi:RNA polymerase sigma-70 factor, ECF subfamily
MSSLNENVGDNFPLESQGGAWLDDKELIRRIRSGEESALCAMMHQYRRQVFLTAYQVLRLQSDAQEVTQDVFWAVWRSPHRFDTGRGALVSWLVILSRSRALDMLRRIRSGATHLDQIGQWAPNLSPDQSVLRDRELLIEEILKRLSPEQYWIIRKVYFEGFTLAEVAALGRTPLGTVKNRARCAIKKLRVELNQGDFLDILKRGPAS